MHRIELDDDFAITFDGRCISLINKVIMTGEGRGSHRMKAENIGKKRDVDAGHYGRLDQALSAYISKSTAACSDVKSMAANLDRIEKSLERFHVKCVPTEAPVLVED